MVATMSRARLSRTAMTCIKEGQDVVTGANEEHQAQPSLRATWEGQDVQLVPTWTAADPVKKHGQGRQVLAHSLTHLRHGTRAQVGSSIRLHAQGPSLRPCRLGRLRAGSALCCPHSSQAPITGQLGSTSTASRQQSWAHRLGVSKHQKGRCAHHIGSSRQLLQQKTHSAEKPVLYMLSEPATPLRKMPVSG